MLSASRSIRTAEEPICCVWHSEFNSDQLSSTLFYRIHHTNLPNAFRPLNRIHLEPRCLRYAISLLYPARLAGFAFTVYKVDNACRCPSVTQEGMCEPPGCQAALQLYQPDCLKARGEASSKSTLVARKKPASTSRLACRPSGAHASSGLDGARCTLHLQS